MILESQAVKAWISKLELSQEEWLIVFFSFQNGFKELYGPK